MSYTIDHPQGEKWVGDNPELLDIYYTPEYYLLNRHIHEGEPLCFIYKERDKLAYYPFFLQQIRGTNHFCIEGAYGYNGVNAMTYDLAFQKNFNDSFHQYCKEQGIIAEFTRFHPVLKNQDFSASYMDIIPDRKTVIVYLSGGYDEIWTGYASNNRNKLRKAHKISLGLGMGETLSDFLNFGRQYRALMRLKATDDSYLWPDAYFEELYKWPREKRFVLFATEQEKTVAGALFLVFNEKAHYHASFKISDGNNVPAANFLLDEGIKECLNRKVETLHLGGGMSRDEQDPLFVFKKGFSSSFGQFSLGKKVHEPGIHQVLTERWDAKHKDISHLYKHYFLRYNLP